MRAVIRAAGMVMKVDGHPRRAAHATPTPITMFKTFLPRAPGIAAAAALGAFCSLPIFGQVNIPQLRGDAGVLSGTLLEPGLHFGLLYASYEPTHVVASTETVMPRIHPLVN